jgi:hypothetical protein|tara:strand:+ start:2851 stop:3654 length:804 start_codon:yes stop_codon:yes gene_type:complete
MNRLINFIKNLIRPIRKILTKLIVEPSVLYPHISKQLWHDSNAFRWAAAYVVKNQIEGDYLEFGVYKGTSFIETYNQILNYSKTFYEGGGGKSSGKENIFLNMKFHAFDSFEGLPETKNNSNPIQYFPGAYSASENLFRDRLINAGLDMEKVTITKGWFNESLNKNTANALSLDKVAIAYIDCDIYESSVDVLEFITPFLQTGSVLVFDDWFRNKGISSTGVQGAVLEWLERNSNIKLQHFYNSDTRTALFIVKIDSKINVSNIDCV